MKMVQEREEKPFSAADDMRRWPGEEEEAAGTTQMKNERARIRVFRR